MRVLLLLTALPCALSIAHSPLGPGAVSIRPRISVAAPPPIPNPSEVREADDTLISVRRSMQRVRQLRRQAKVQALRLSRSSRAAAEAVSAEADRYERSLADLEDIQRTLMRSAKAGLLKERRMAERKFRAWTTRDILCAKNGICEL